MPTRIRIGASMGALPAWLFALWAMLMVLRVHAPYIAQPSEQSLDEGYLLAIGQLMRHGRMLPFVDGVAHTGPMFLLTGALISALGEFSWLPIRVAAAIGFAATSGSRSFAVTARVAHSPERSPPQPCRSTSACAWILTIPSPTTPSCPVWCSRS